MYEFGKIVLIPFPFTDLSSTKVRPALVLSKNVSDQDVIVAFISSREQKFKNVLEISADDDFFAQTGLKVRSQVRLDKLATLNKGLVLGELGSVPLKVLNKNASKFRRVFGFI